MSDPPSQGQARFFAIFSFHILACLQIFGYGLSETRSNKSARGVLNARQSA